MVIDTSAIFALIAQEPESADYRAVILAAPSVSISAFSLLEIRTVLHGRLGVISLQLLEAWLAETGIAVVAFDQEQSEAAFVAFRRYGKGQGHPAQLNIGDCASYALAKTRDETLLFKGGDFAKTDITPAVIN